MDAKLLQIPPTEYEIAELLSMTNEQTMTEKGKMVLRRLVFQRDLLLEKANRLAVGDAKEAYIRSNVNWK